MTQQTLAKWLKGIIIGMAVCGLLIIFVIVPFAGHDLALAYPEFSYCFWPWFIFLFIALIPCYFVLVWMWSIASEIGKDRSFTMKNAVMLKRIMMAAIFDTAFFFLVNVIYLFLNMSHPSVLIASLFVCFAGVAIAVAAAGLSHLVGKAAAIREENDSFI